MNLLNLFKRNKYYERSFIMKSMKCFKIYDLAVALTNYFSKNKIKNKIKISNKFHGEKFEEELYSINEAISKN